MPLRQVPPEVICFLAATALPGRASSLTAFGSASPYGLVEPMGFQKEDLSAAEVLDPELADPLDVWGARLGLAKVAPADL